MHPAAHSLILVTLSQRSGRLAKNLSGNLSPATVQSLYRCPPEGAQMSVSWRQAFNSPDKCLNACLAFNEVDLRQRRFSRAAITDPAPPPAQNEAMYPGRPRSSSIAPSLSSASSSCTVASPFQNRSP